MIKKFFKKLIFWKLWIWARIYRFFFSGSDIVVLMYHSVGYSGWVFSVTPEQLDQHITYLKSAGYVFLTVAELERIIKGVTQAPRRGILITFDDGYQDFLIHAVPVLKKHQVTAINFIHTNREHYKLGNDFSMLSWDEIRQARALGMDFGNHSHSHPSFKTLTPEELHRELQTAEDIFTRELDSKPVYLAYPGGLFNADVVAVVKERGYHLAFTIDQGLVTHRSNPLILPRVGISLDTSLMELKARTTMANIWYQWLIDLIKHSKKKLR